MIKFFDSIYESILKEIEKDYLSNYRDDLLGYFKKEETIASIKKIIKENHYSGKAIVDLLLPLLNSHKSMSPNQWLEYIYKFNLSLSYPEKVKINFEEKLIPLIYFYLNTLRIFCKTELKSKGDKFLIDYPIEFLTLQEEKNTSKEYFYFKEAYSRDYIYELMYIDMEISGHNTLEHLVGVNHLSLYIARQLKESGLPIDLGIVVAASLAHDLGKYGVLEEDQKKVPYYHYYYSDCWYKKNKMPNISHIASNHSTWDLELENLPLESLLLIYADFRVKNKISKGNYKMHFYSLDQAYDIILNKLDNLDEEKEQRYERVYRKLKDFEDFLHHKGINTDLDKKLNPFKENYHEVFMNSMEVVASFKYLAIENNILLMHKLIDQNSFNNILEMVRSEYNWRKLRVYLQVFNEYSTYLTKGQKDLLINFLLELLFHSEEDIRKESALLIGLLLSDYDEVFRKELPPSVQLKEETMTSYHSFDKILDYFCYPNHKDINSSIDWQYNLKNIVKSLFSHAKKENLENYIDVLLKYYYKDDYRSSKIYIYLAQTSKYIPYEFINERQKISIFNYMEKILKSPSQELRLTILDIIDEIHEEILDHPYFKNIIKNYLSSGHIYDNPTEIYLQYKLALKLGLDKNSLKYYERRHRNTREDSSDIYLKNLKTATDWMNKKINIDILYDYVLEEPERLGLHTAMHFCNLLKVSAVEKVRNYAGHTLINIFPYLSIEEKNDIVVELLRALEMQNYQFTKYIPKYLGRAILRLERSELNEIIDDLEVKIKTSNIQTSFLILQLVGYSIEYIEEYEEADRKEFEKTLNRLVGILLIGMASYKEDIKIEALRILGSSIFNSRRLVLEDKYYIFNILAKKMLILLPSSKSDDYLLLNNSSSFNNLYRFILDYEFEYSNLKLDSKKKYAFFPGSFDPFTNGHRAIVRTIRDLGFEVYLAIDEFSWSKRTQAHNFRKNIINMSLANERDIFIFPGDLPINISNDEDLEKLKLLFDSTPYIVIGVDVLLNASAYRKDNLITSFPHIIIDREDDKEELLEDKLKLLKAETIFLDIEKDYRDISSTKIRKRIDLERDISDKIDPLAEKYISEYGLYLREPEYKHTIEAKTIDYSIYNPGEITGNLEKEIESFIEDKSIYRELLRKDGLKFLILRNYKNKKIIGLSSFYEMDTAYFLDEFKNMETTDFLRNKIKGRTICLPYLYSPRNFNTLLNESLFYALGQGFNHAIIRLEKNLDIDFPRDSIEAHGFLDLPQTNRLSFIVDMNSPISFTENIEIFLKPPFDRDLSIKNSIEKSRLKVKKAISQIYPGQLIIASSRDMVYSKLIDQICNFNGVKNYEGEKRQLGDFMCVPFGNILNDNIIPNTVTKTIHAEKVFSKDLSSFKIENSPNYLSLSDQVKVLKSFNRPLILVDDILHRGHRLSSIFPYLKKENLDISLVITGILSGKGLEIARSSGIDIRSAYFIPNLKLWLNESSLIPFLGGDMVESNRKLNFLLPSINFILPYANPHFIDSSRGEVFQYSRTILENSISFFESLEASYQREYKKNLLIRNLGQVLTMPRKPDSYTIIDYSAAIKPSQYLREDLKLLERLY